MATDNHAHYSRIGFMLVAGAAAIVATLVYFGGFRSVGSEILLETYYDSPVNGLSVGSPVNLFGVKIGEVREISFALGTYYDRGADSNDFGRVSIVMAINKKSFGLDAIDDDELADYIDTRTKNGLRATVQSNGITGLSRIDLTIRDGEPVPEPPHWEPRYPLIMPSPSLFDNFSVAATKLMNRLKTMDFASVWSNVQRLADASAHTAENADALMESQKAEIRQIVTDAASAAAAIRELAETVRDNPSLLVRPADPNPLSETSR